MTAYLIVQVDISDMEQYREYTKQTPPIVEKYGGKFIARSSQVVTLEGPEEKRRVVILEFPSMEQLTSWYHSDEYQNAKAVREGAAVASFIGVEGV